MNRRRGGRGPGPVELTATKLVEVPGRAPIVVCPICGAMSCGAPPHGEGQPCPQKLKIDEAYIAKADAERMLAIRSAEAVERMPVAMADAMADSLDRHVGDDDG